MKNGKTSLIEKEGKHLQKVRASITPNPKVTRL
jgi:hypothetical protein